MLGGVLVLLTDCHRKLDAAVKVKNEAKRPLDASSGRMTQLSENPASENVNKGEVNHHIGGREGGRGKDGMEAKREVEYEGA